MKLALVVLTAMMVLEAHSGEAVIRKVTGDVQVRRGIAEQWSTVVSGESITSNATIKVGPGSSSVLEIEGKTIKLPAETIVDISDIRKLTKEELMLKLAMENIRSSSYEWKSNEMNNARTTVTHGDDKSTRRTLTENDINDGRQQLNGMKVLFENSYFSTCALKSKEIFRRYPQLSLLFENRYRLAKSLEAAGLPREALNEYKAIGQMENLTSPQKDVLSRNVASLSRGE